MRQAASRARKRASKSCPRAKRCDYESPEQVDFRGDFKPELVQLLMRMRHEARRTSRARTSSRR